MPKLTSAVTPGSPRKLRLLPLLAATYFMVSGGPYGLEEIIGDAGYGWALVILLVLPFFWSLPTALMIGELAAAVPEERGFYAWVRRALGPFWGFQEAWLSLAASVFDMAIYPTLFVTYLEHFSNWGPTLANGHRELFIELAVVLIATLWNLRGAVAVGSGSVVMWIVGLAPFIVLLGAACWRGLHTAPATLAPPHGHADLAAGMLVALWNYMGWDNASTIAGEVEDPQRTYPRVMVIATLMTMATYLLPVAAVWFSGIAPDQFSTGAWVDAAQNLVGYPLALTLTLVASLDSLGNFNSLTMSYTRLPYALACDGLLPEVLARKLPNGVPWVSLLVCAVGWSLALRLKFDRLITIDISLWGLSVVLEFIALVKLRVSEPDLPRPFRVPGPTWVAVALGVGPAALVVFALWVAYGWREGNRSDPFRRRCSPWQSPLGACRCTGWRNGGSVESVHTKRTPLIRDSFSWLDNASVTLLDYVSAAMQLVPENIQLAGHDLAIKWNDGRESYLELEALRRACPCAGCQGEPDIDGRIDKPHVSYDPARSFRLKAWSIIGGYAFQPTWEDGHSTGLYTFDLLRRLGQTEALAPTP